MGVNLLDLMEPTLSLDLFFAYFIFVVLPTFLWVKIICFDEPFSCFASGGFIVYEPN
jgi:hypothetical protein